MRVTVVPDDNFISVNGEGLVFPFPHEPDMHALQWAETAGHIEYKPQNGVMPANRPLGEEDFASVVQPYVTLHAQEKARRTAEEQAEAQRKLDEYNSEPARFDRLRAERDARIAATDYLMTSDYPLTDEQRAAVTAYRTALRDLPAQDGAPWDGGGEETPWPVMPKL